MSLSTSNSKKNKIKLLLAVLLIFSTIEVFTRTIIFHASKDFARFDNYPALSRDLTNSEGIKIALVGNSLTQRGVNLDILSQDLKQSEEKKFIAKMFTADASKINTWHFMINHYFWKPKRKPDYFLVHFYEKNLQDGNAIETGRLAQFFTTPSDWPDLFRLDITNPGEQVEFGISSFWATFAARERLRERVLGIAVPHFKDFTSETNGVNFRMGKKNQAQKQYPVRYEALQRLLHKAKQEGSHFCFIAFPTQPTTDPLPYSLDPEAERLIREAEMEFIDLRHVTGLELKHYADEIHLTPEGAAIYSHALATALKPVLVK